MKVVLLGSKGYLAGHFLGIYPDAVCPKVDIANADDVSKMLDEEKPDILINAAGKTGRPNVDWCEDHREETLRSNVTGPLVLLDECGKRGVYWVQLGSGCLYTGDNGGKGFSEEDPPNFAGSFYARTKAWIDQILKEFPVLLLRLRMPFDNSDHPRSLISKILKYDRVLDVQNSLTYVPDFLKAAQALIEKKTVGSFNLVNPGSISPYQIMQKYSELCDPNHAFEKLTLENLKEVVQAERSNCVLNTEKLEGEGISMTPVEEAVKLAIQARIKA